MTNKEIGIRIKQTRERRAMTLDDVAARVGVARSTILRYEDGTIKKLKLPILESIANALSVNPEWLVGKTDKQFAVTFRGDGNEAPSLSDEAVKLGKQYDALDAHGKEIVSVVADRETARMEAARKVVDLPQQKKVIPLIGNRFAAGFGDPDLNVAWEDYEVDAGSRAEFAVHISGDSLEPHLHDGDIALAVKRMPDIGEVGAYLVDGDFLVKQTIEDAFGNLYLKAVNRKRKDTDRTLLRAEEHQLICFGTLILPHLPLPQE